MQKTPMALRCCVVAGLLYNFVETFPALFLKVWSVPRIYMKFPCVLFDIVVCLPHPNLDGPCLRRMWYKRMRGRLCVLRCESIIALHFDGHPVKFGHAVAHVFL